MRGLAGTLVLLLFTTACQPSAHQESQRLALATDDTSRPDVTTRRIWSVPEPNVLLDPSPDGRAIAITDWSTGDIAIRGLATGETRRVTRNTGVMTPGFGMFPRFSPDGSQLAFNWAETEGPEEFDLRVAGVDGGGVRSLVESVPWIHPEAWSPDGRTILALRAREDGTAQISLVSSEDGSTRVLKSLGWELPRRMSFSPDGRWVAYDYPPDDETRRRDLYVLAVDGSREVHLVDEPSDDVLLGWAPDGRILYLSDRSGTPSAWLVPVEEGRATGPAVLVKRDLWRAHPVAFTDDGDYIYGVELDDRGVYSVQFDPRTGSVAGPPAHLLAPDAVTDAPAWSPDGRHLSYVRTPPRLGITSRRMLMVRSVETGEERQLPLPRSMNYVYGQAWSADGGSVFLLGMMRGNRRVLLRIDARTGECEEVLDGPASTSGRINGFAVTPDGSALVIVRSGGETGGGAPRAHASLVDLQAGSERILHEAPGIRQLAASPDGSHVAVLQTGGSSSTHAELVLVPLDGGEARAVARIRVGSYGWHGSMTWQRDGRAILYARNRAETPEAEGTDLTMQLYRVHLDDGRIEALGLEMPRMGALELHPDGRRLVFAAGTPQFELWKMENLLPDQTGAGISTR